MSKLLDQASPIPLYKQLTYILKKKIMNEEWPVGSLTPTELELINEYKVSRTTVREAVTALVNEGLLEKKQGKGTIVIWSKVEERLGKLTGLTEELIERGINHSAKLISADFKTDLYYEISRLALSEKAKVFVIHRIRLADEGPIAYEKSCWPEEIGKMLSSEDLNTASFYHVLEDKHGIFLKEANETIHAVNATPYEAELLGVSPGEALLERRRVTYDVLGNPIEYTRTKYRSDKYAYKVHLERN